MCALTFIHDIELCVSTTYVAFSWLLYFLCCLSYFVTKVSHWVCLCIVERHGGQLPVSEELGQIYSIHLCETINLYLNPIQSFNGVRIIVSFPSQMIVKLNAVVMLHSVWWYFFELYLLSVFVYNIKPQYFGNGSIFAFRLRGYEQIPDLLGPLGGVSHTL